MGVGGRCMNNEQKAVVQWQRQGKITQRKTCTCHPVHHKSHTDWPGVVSWPPRRPTSELWYGHNVPVVFHDFAI